MDREAEEQIEKLYRQSHLSLPFRQLPDPKDRLEPPSPEANNSTEAKHDNIACINVVDGDTTPESIQPDLTPRSLFSGHATAALISHPTHRLPFTASLGTAEPLSLVHDWIDNPEQINASLSSAHHNGTHIQLFPHMVNNTHDHPNPISEWLNGLCTSLGDTNHDTAIHEDLMHLDELDFVLFEESSDMSHAAENDADNNAEHREIDMDHEFTVEDIPSYDDGDGHVSWTLLDTPQPMDHESPAGALSGVGGWCIE